MSRGKSGEHQRENPCRLKDVVQTRFEENRTRVNRIREVYWRSVLNPSILNVLMVVREQMSLLELVSYIEHLSENRQETSRYEIVLWQKIIYPFAVLVMMVLALPFAYFQVREGGVSGKIFTGIMLGLGFHLANRLFGHLRLLNAWPPLFSAIAPTLALLAAGVAMMWKVEKR